MRGPEKECGCVRGEESSKARRAFQNRRLPHSTAHRTAAVPARRNATFSRAPQAHETGRPGRATRTSPEGASPEKVRARSPRRRRANWRVPHHQLLPPSVGPQDGRSKGGGLSRSCRTAVVLWDRTPNSGPAAAQGGPKQDFPVRSGRAPGPSVPQRDHSLAVADSVPHGRRLRAAWPERAPPARPKAPRRRRGRPRPLARRRPCDAPSTARAPSLASPERIGSPESASSASWPGRHPRPSGRCRPRG